MLRILGNLFLLYFLIPGVIHAAMKLREVAGMVELRGRVKLQFEQCDPGMRVGRGARQVFEQDALPTPGERSGGRLGPNSGIPEDIVVETRRTFDEQERKAGERQWIWV